MWRQVSCWEGGSAHESGWDAARVELILPSVPAMKRCCARAKVGEAMPKAILMLIGNFPLFAIFSKLAVLLCWSVRSVRPAVRPLHLKLSHESVLSLSLSLSLPSIVHRQSGAEWSGAGGIICIKMDEGEIRFFAAASFFLSSSLSVHCRYAHTTTL